MNSTYKLSSMDGWMDARLIAIFPDLLGWGIKGGYFLKKKYTET